MNQYKAKKTFTVGDGISAVFKVRDREIQTVVEDISDPILGITVSHIHEPIEALEDHRDCWYTNLEEYLHKNDDGSYFYRDASRDAHLLKPQFYSINTVGEKVVSAATAEQVRADATGRLWYGETEVFRDLRSPDGLRATTRLSDVNDAEWIEQRYEEEKKAEEQLDALEEHLCSFALVRGDTGEEHAVVTADTLSSPDAVEALLAQTEIAPTNDSEAVPLYLLTKDEAVSYRSLLEQREAFSIQLAGITENARNLLLQLNATDSSGYQGYANAIQGSSNTYELAELQIEINDYTRRLNNSTTAKRIQEMEKSQVGTENSLENKTYNPEDILTEDERILLEARRTNCINRRKLLGLPVSSDEPDDLVDSENSADDEDTPNEYNKNELWEMSNTLLAAQTEDVAAQKNWIKRQINNFQMFSPTEYADDDSIGDGMLTKQYDSIISQVMRLVEQTSALLARDAEYREELPKRYTEYLSTKANVEEISYIIPVAFLVSDHSAKGYNENGQLVTLQSKDGKRIAISWQKHTKSGSRKPTAVYDEDDNRMIFRYNEDGSLAEIVNSQGDRTVFAYDDVTKKMTIVRATLPTAEIVHENVYVKQIVVDNLETTTFSYDAENRLSEMVTTTTVKEISHGVVTKIAETESPTELSRVGLTYGTNEVKLTYHHPAKEEYFTWNEETELLAWHYFAENGKVVSAERYAYDDSTHQLLMQGGFAQNSMHTYTPEEFLSSAEIGDEEWYTYNDFYELMHVARYRYGAAGQAGAEKEIAEVEYTYNADGKVACVKTATEKCDSSNGATLDTRVMYEKTTYNSKGNPVRVERYTEGKESTLGIDVSETVYDKDGKLLRSYSYNTLSPSDKIYTESETDESGRTVADLDATGKHKTSYTYFADGSLASETAPNGSMLAYAYDKDGTQVSVTSSTADGEGNTNVTHYTAGLVTRVESGNHVVDYVYDEKRRLTAVKLDGADYETYTYTPNTDGTETVAIRYAGNHEDVVITKNAAGDITNLSLGSFANATFTYTADGRVLTAHDAYSTRDFSYTYDSEKRMIAEDNLWGCRKAVTYDARGRVDTQTVTRLEFPAAGGEPQNKTISYGYEYDESSGRLSSVSVDDTTTVLPSYDALGRSVGKRIQYNDALIAQEKIDYLKHGDHATVLPLTVRYAKGNAWTDKLRYTYDCMGNITAVYEDEMLVCRYAYDALGRLSREDNKHFGKTKLFFYDTNGNITSRREYAFTVKTTEELTEIEPQVVVEYKYDGDRLISYGGDTRFTYNAVGFATKYRGKTLNHSYGKHLELYDRHGTPLNLFYDGSSYGGGGITQDKDGNILSDDNFRFLYDNTGMLGFVDKGSNDTYFYRRDVQGNVIAILDNSGAVVVQYKYDAWGNCTVTNVSEEAIETNLGNRNPIRYRGYYYDTSLELYRLTTRYYDPETGRFTSADTLDYLAPDTVNGLNLYAYCGNNPVMKVDPTGHEGVTIAIIVCAAILAVAFAIAGGIYAHNKASNAGATGLALVAQTAVGVVAGALFGAALGALIGYCLPYIGAFLSASFTFSLPAIASVSGGAAVAASVTVTGAQIVAGVLVAGGAIALGVEIMFQKPSTGPIRFNDGTGLDPDSGRPVKDKDVAYRIYKELKDLKSKQNWKKWMKGKGWRTNHLK